MSNTNTSSPKSPEGIDHQAWLESLKAGDKVWWTDPDDGLSSGEVIVEINQEKISDSNAGVDTKNKSLSLGGIIFF